MRAGAERGESARPPARTCGVLLQMWFHFWGGYPFDKSSGLCGLCKGEMCILDMTCEEYDQRVQEMMAQDHGKYYDEDEKGIVLCVFASRFRWDDVFLFRRQDRCEEVGR